VRPSKNYNQIAVLVTVALIMLGCSGSGDQNNVSEGIVQTAIAETEQVEGAIQTAIAQTAEAVAEVSDGAVQTEIVITEEAIELPTSTEPPPTTDISSIEPDPSDLGWLLLFEDMFDDNNNNWIVGSKTSDLAVRDRSVVGGVYRWNIDAFGFSHWTAFGKFDPSSDIHASVLGHQVAGNPDPSYGLIFRINGSGAYYGFFINENTRSFVAIRFQDGRSFLIPWSESEEIQPGRSNRISVTATGAKFDLYINGLLVGSFDDSVYPTGGVGVAVLMESDTSATVEFDDIGVYEQPK